MPIPTRCSNFGAVAMFWDTGKSQRCGNLTGTTLNASHSGSKRATLAVSGSPNAETWNHGFCKYIGSITKIAKIVDKPSFLKGSRISKISHFLYTSSVTWLWLSLSVRCVIAWLWLSLVIVRTGINVLVGRCPEAMSVGDDFPIIGFKRWYYC